MKFAGVVTDVHWAVLWTRNDPMCKQWTYDMINDHEEIKFVNYINILQARIAELEARLKHETE